MFWTAVENTEAIIESLHLAAERSARACVFPELAITGFHRQIKREATREIVPQALSRVRDTCAKLGIAAIIGTPSFDAEGNIFNSVEFIDEHGATKATITKVGLTTPEATFFAKGTARPILDFVGYRSTAIVCREANDVELLKSQIAPNTVDIIYWPGIMRPDPEKPEKAEQHLLDAATLAKHAGAYVIQANWPTSLNYPEESADAGHSIVISPGGETMFRLPKARVGMGLFTLGDPHFEWINC